MPPSDQTLIFFNGCKEKAPDTPHVPAFLLIFAKIDWHASSIIGILCFFDN